MFLVDYPYTRAFRFTTGKLSVIERDSSAVARFLPPLNSHFFWLSNQINCSNSLHCYKPFDSPLSSA